MIAAYDLSSEGQYLHNKFDILDRSVKSEIFSGFSYFHNCKAAPVIVMTSYVYKVNLLTQLQRKNQRFKGMYVHLHN